MHYVQPINFILRIWILLDPMRVLTEESWDWTGDENDTLKDEIVLVLVLSGERHKTILVFPLLLFFCHRLKNIAFYYSIIELFALSISGNGSWDFRAFWFLCWAQSIVLHRGPKSIPCSMFVFSAVLLGIPFMLSDITLSARFWFDLLNNKLKIIIFWTNYKLKRQYIPLH